MEARGTERIRWGFWAEPLTFLAAALAYLWLVSTKTAWPVALLAAWTAISWRRRKLGLDELGLGWAGAKACFGMWWWLWAGASLAVVAVGQERLGNPSLLKQGAVYFAWAWTQQLVYQSMIYVQLREGWKRPVGAAVVAGAAFALMHWPNPVLVPATFAWGVISSLIFERTPSVWCLGLLQTAFSSVLLWLAPADLSRNFRVGPHYFKPWPAPDPDPLSPPAR